MSLSTEASHLRDALSAEFYKVRRRRMTYILLGVHCGLVILFYFILFMQIRDGPSPRRNGFTEWLALRNAMTTPTVRQSYSLPIIVPAKMTQTRVAKNRSSARP